MKNHLRTILILLALPLMGASCTIVTSKEQDGGVYRTNDSGTTWTHLTTVADDAVRIDRTNAQRIVVDPRADGALYLATRDNGVLRTENRGDEWRKTGLTSGAVYDIAADPTTPDLVYAARGQDVLKSINGADDWRAVYSEATADAYVADVVVDWYTPSKIFAGSTDGSVIRSDDYGTTWTRITAFSRGVRYLLMSPVDSRMVFAVLFDAGLWRTTDGGASWTELTQSLDEWDSAETVNWVAFSPTEPSVIYLATDYGLLRSDSLGDAWTPVQTLVEYETVPIFRIVVNTDDGNELFVSAGNHLYRTADRGATWESVESYPSSRRIETVVIDPENAAMVYVGARSIK